MKKWTRFPYSPRGHEVPDTATRLSEGVAMTDKEEATVDHRGPIPPERVAFHVHGLDALVVEMAFLNDKMKALLDDLYKSRMFVDNWYPISANVGYEVDYKDHKLLYLYSLPGVTLVVEGVTITVPPNAWTSISLHRGAKIYAQNVADSAPTTVLVRACDELQDSAMLLLTELVDIEQQQSLNIDGITVQSLAAVGPGTYLSLIQINPTDRGCMLCINVTAISGAGTLTVTILEVDPVSGGTNGILTSVVIAAVGKTFMHVYPGIAPAGNVSASAFLPRSWQVSSVESGAATTVSATISAALEE